MVMKTAASTAAMGVMTPVGSQRQRHRRWQPGARTAAHSSVQASAAMMHSSVGCSDFGGSSTSADSRVGARTAAATKLAAAVMMGARAGSQLRADSR
ncbi:hypothetical protein Dimus_013574, partial [Dionaea muscipula]